MAWNQGILVCGFYGYHNLGDEAMLHGLFHWLQRCELNFPLTIYSKDPEDTRHRHGVRVLDNRYAPRRRAKFQQWMRHTSALWQHPYFILGGGDLLRDAPDRDVADEWLRPLERAIALDKRTLVLGISVGKIWRERTQARIKSALNRVDLIAVRDHTSRKRLIEFGVTYPIHVMSDLALEGIFPCPHVSVNLSAPNIGISVRPVAGRSATQTDEWFYQRLAAVIDHLIENYNASIHLLPFQAYPPTFRRQNSPSIDDEVAIAQVTQFSRYPDQLLKYGRFPNLETLITCLSTLDVMVGTRLHSVILASGLGIPVVALEYAPKVRGFMSEIGQLDYCLDLEALTCQQSVSLINHILNDWVAVRQQLCAAVKRYKTRMDTVDLALKEIF